MTVGTTVHDSAEPAVKPAILERLEVKEYNPRTKCWRTHCPTCDMYGLWVYFASSGTTTTYLRCTTNDCQTKRILGKLGADEGILTRTVGEGPTAPERGQEGAKAQRRDAPPPRTPSLRHKPPRNPRAGGRGWSMLQDAVVDHYLPQLNERELKVYLVLLRMSKHGECFPATGTIARRVDLNVRSVQYATRRLEELGLIVKLPPHALRRATIYEIVDLEGRKPEPEPVPVRSAPPIRVASPAPTPARAPARAPRTPEEIALDDMPF